MTKSTYRLSRASQIKGGHARALALSRRRRKEIARKAAQARWAKANGKKAVA